ncbi:MAG: hypothetical protein JRN06_10055 [Nitrososphaerota archaeon]|nr:hypothetical protein [Nitrososphaerota archaeon]MDG7024930.1 hypothetical protein [Nitrososphaerota archaeon]
MTNYRGMIIAKRSVSLSKTYPIMGVLMAVVGLVLSSLPGLVGNVAMTGVPANSTSAASDIVSSGLPFIAVPLQAFAALIFATPVLLLFVYDKNNGVLEYFLSLGMNQRDVYRQYLKAALILSVAVVSFEVVLDIAAGVFAGGGVMTLEVSGLVVAISLPAVAFGTLLMMSFSSLQKQRVGSNQPLGMAIGVFTVMPSYILPFIVPSSAFLVDLLLAAAIVFMSGGAYFASGRLISREKLLP